MLSISIYNYFLKETELIPHIEFEPGRPVTTAKYFLATAEMIEENKTPFIMNLEVDYDENAVHLSGDVVWEYKRDLQKILEASKYV